MHLTPSTCPFSFAAHGVVSKAKQGDNLSTRNLCAGRLRSHHEPRTLPISLSTFELIDNVCLLTDERDERGAGIGNGLCCRTCADCFRKFTSVTFTAFSLNIGAHKQVWYQFVKRFSLLDFLASFRSSIVWSVQWWNGFYLRLTVSD